MGQKVVVRIPPSPTGKLHIGNARTALFNFLFAKKENGKVILRIEDTDRERSKREYENDILESLKWLGITYDEFCRQSERTSDYHSKLQELIDGGKAYVSDETKTNHDDPIRTNGRPGRPTSNGVKVVEKRSSVIRLRNSGRVITFNDVIRGEITFDTTELGDIVIAKSLDEPVYHFAVVVDDFLMSVTHVIRGEDHISNTPRQILIQEAIGAPQPIYAHIPLVLAVDRSKLSKRHGAVAVTEFRNQGYLPEAIVNYLALLGFSPSAVTGDHGPTRTDTRTSADKEREIFTMDELVELFDLKKVQKSGAVFDIEKLNWMNREHIKNLRQEEILEAIGERLPQIKASSLVPLILERINKWSDIEEKEWLYFFEQPVISKELLVGKSGAIESGLKVTLDKLIELLDKVDDSAFSSDSIKAAIWDYATETGRGKVLWPMRVALSGREKSPDPFTIASVLGKDETITRLQNAGKILSTKP